MAEVLIKYKADAGELEATVNKINEVNNEAVKSAQKASDKIATEFKDAAKSAAAAFSGGEVKKALDSNTSSIEKLAKSGKTLTGQLRGLKQELTLLEQQGKDNTKEFNQLLIAAAKLEDQIGDTRARVRILAADTFKFDAAVQATQGLAAGFEVAQGAAALFGSESEDLQKGILKVQGAIAVANGVQQIANLLLEESEIKTAILTAKTAIYNTVVGTSTGALKAFRIALAATGVGLLVIGLIALIENFDKVKAALENSVPSFKTVSNAIGNVVDTIKEWVGASDDAERAGAAFENASKRQADATKKIVDGYNRRIEVEKTAGRNTTQLEIEREKAVIAANQKILKDFQAKQSKILDLDKEERDKLLQTQKDAADAVQEASNNILVIRTTAAKEAADKAKEEAKKAAEAEKKELEQLEKDRKDLLAKRVANQKAANDSIAALREADLQEQLQAVSVAEDASFQLRVESLEKQKAIEIAAAEEAGQLTYDIEKKYAVLIADLKSEQAQKEITTRINTLKQLEAAEGSTLERRIQLIEEQANAQKLQIANSIKDEKERASAILLLETETQNAIREERKKTNQQTIDYAFEVADAVANTLGTIVELQGAQSQARIDEINNTATLEQEAINKSLESEADKQRKLDALRLRTSRQIAAEKTKQAKSERALNVFKAVIDTAASITKTGAQLGYPAAIPFQVAAGVIGATQIAAILAQPLPKFKKGGIVGGRSHDAGGTLIEAERGEFVVNRNAVTRHRSELDALNTSSAAFKRLIDERYVRPALNYYMGKKERAINVNASLNSKGMEKEIKGMRRDLKRNNTVININGNDSRYAWHLN
jgi:hypothetical protein